MTLTSSRCGVDGMRMNLGDRDVQPGQLDAVVVAEQLPSESNPSTHIREPAGCFLIRRFADFNRNACYRGIGPNQIIETTPRSATTVVDVDTKEILVRRADGSSLHSLPPPLKIEVLGAHASHA